MRIWLVALIAGMLFATDVAAQQRAQGTAHLTVGTVMRMDVVPGAGSVRRGVDPYREVEGATLLRVRANGAWRVELERGSPATRAVVEGVRDRPAASLWLRATVVEGDARVDGSYREVETGSVVASGRGGEVLVRIDYRWLSSVPAPDADVVYTLAPGR